MQSERAFLYYTILCEDAYNPNLFTILEVSNNELQLSVRDALLITKHQPEPHK